MLKKFKKIIILLLIILLFLISFTIFCGNKSDLRTIKSKKELSRIYEGKGDAKETFINIISLPFSAIVGNWGGGYRPIYNNQFSVDEAVSISPAYEANSSSSSSSSSKDYSTTNIQVENVDEADITKTDGDYIYSISEDKVIITDVRIPNLLEIAAEINSKNGYIPEDLILYVDKLVIIYEKASTTSRYYYSENDTMVRVYNITNKQLPKLIKEYELFEPYYTSRCIDNMLYVISSGRLREEDNEVIINYKEDGIQKDIELRNIKYLKDVDSTRQTLISALDLDNVKEDIDVSSYLIDISNAYVSENSIYLLDQKYDYNNDAPPIRSLFGLKGAIGPFVYEYEEEFDSDSGYKTEVYKFEIEKNGKISYATKSKIKGRTINQYSLDEYNGHFRIALYDYDGSRVVVFDENLNQIGASDYVAKGETMYSSRFMGEKVYLVTYRNMDPLFVIDLSNEKRPRVLGELKIPGYSTYLHPYDENHLIGIGMETEEVINRNSSGQVLSTTSKIMGMKMALFDVSDVNNPIELSNTVIGDRRTTSAILTNPKALLFSKERNLIAIPVNNYSEDFEIETSSDSYSSLVNSYQNYDKEYIAEGYFVYNIDLTNGFNLKGTITHEKTTTNDYYSFYNTSKLLRGLYIDKNLYTISEEAIKINDLETLNPINELKLK